MAARLKTCSVMCLRGTVSKQARGLVADQSKGGRGGSPGLTLEPWLPKGGRGDSAINSLQGSSAASPVHTKVMLVMPNRNILNVKSKICEIYNDDLKSHKS